MTDEAERIRADAVEVGDRIQHMDTTFVVTRIKPDGGFRLIYGGAQPMSLADGERLWRLPPDDAAGADDSETGEESDPPDSTD